MDDRIYARYMSNVAYFLSKLETAPESYYFIPIALAYNKLGKYDETISICRKGLEHFPSSCPARVLLAEAYLYKGDTDQARDLLFDVLVEDGDNYKALKLLGIIYQTLEMNDEAIRYLRGAYIRSPEDVELKKTLKELGASVDIDDILKESTGNANLSAEEEDEESKTFMEIEQKIKNAELVMADLASDHTIMGPSHGHEEPDKEESNTLSDDELENLISQAGNITYTPSVQGDDNSTFFDTSHLFGMESEPVQDVKLHGDNERAADVEDIVAEYNRDYGNNILDGIPERATTPEDVDAIIAAFQREEEAKSGKKSPPKKETPTTSSNTLSNDEIDALLGSFQEEKDSNEVFDDELENAIKAHEEMRANSNEVFNDELENAIKAHEEMRANSNEVFNDELENALKAHEEINKHDETTSDLLSALSDNEGDTLMGSLIADLNSDDVDETTNDLLSALGDSDEVTDENDTSAEDLLSVLGEEEISIDDVSSNKIEEDGTTEDLLSELIGSDNQNISDDTEVEHETEENIIDKIEENEVSLSSIDSEKETIVESNELPKDDTPNNLEFSLEDMISDDEDVERNYDDDTIDENLGESSPFIQADILDEIYESSKIDEEIETLEESITYIEDEVVTKDSLKELSEYRSLKERQIDKLEETLDKIRKKAEI